MDVGLVSNWRLSAGNSDVHVLVGFLVPPSKASSAAAGTWPHATSGAARSRFGVNSQSKARKSSRPGRPSCRFASIHISDSSAGGRTARLPTGLGITLITQAASCA